MKHYYLFLLTLLFSAGTLNAQYLSQNFEGTGGNLPADWTMGSAGGDDPALADGWIVATPDSASSENFTFLGTPAQATSVVYINDDECDCVMNADTLISPEMTLPGTSTQIEVNADVAYRSGSFQGADESLSLIYSTDNGASWTVVKDDLNASTSTQSGTEFESQKYVINLDAGTTSLRVGFLYSDGGGWLFGAALDNIVVQDFTGPQVEAEVLFSDLPDYVSTSIGSHEIRVQNIGGENITSLTVETVINGGAPVSNTVTGFDIPFGETDDVEVPLSVTEGVHTIEFTVTEVNGSADGDDTDNMTSREIAALSTSAPRSALIEQATGAWCGWCPDGKLILQDASQNPNIVGATWHQGDPLELPIFSTIGNTYIGGYPSGMVNRFNYAIPTVDPIVDMSRNQWNQLALNSLNDPTPFDFTMTHQYDTASRTITIDLEVEVVGPVLGDDYRFNVYLIQDSIYADDYSGLDQENYYSSASVGPAPSHPYYNLPATVSDYYHLETIIEALGGAWGEMGSLPSTMTMGETYTYSFTYMMPETKSILGNQQLALLPEQTKIVGLVQRYEAGDVGRRYVMNAAGEQLDVPSIVGVADAFDAVSGLKVSPNPASSIATVNFSLSQTAYAEITLTDLTGRTLKTIDAMTFTAGDHMAAFDASDLASGVYLISLKSEAGASTVKFVKQ